MIANILPEVAQLDDINGMNYILFLIYLIKKKEAGFVTTHSQYLN
jgi:hypothetical protein